MSHEPTQTILDPASSLPNSPIEQVTSIVVTGNSIDLPVIVMGTRSGDIISLCLNDYGHTIYSEKFGVSAAQVYRCTQAGAPSSVLVCADDKLFHLSEYKLRERRFSRKHQVFAIDACDASRPTMPISSVTMIEPVGGVPGGGVAGLLMLGESRGTPSILVSQLLPEPRTLPRTIPVFGTPTVVIYSPDLDCLIVALERNESSSLVFIDPDTGEDLSRPTDKDGQAQENISGLEKRGDKIFSLYEWMYENKGYTWRFFVVGTRDGRLIIVSAEPEQCTNTDGSRPSSRKIAYWTRYKARVSGPVFAIVAGDDGLFFCAGRTLHWQRLDLEQKRLVEVYTYEIDSPATVLSIHGDSLFALSIKHSIEVIQKKYNGDGATMDLEHCDPMTREAIHMIVLGSEDTPDQKRQLVIVTDIYGGITGMTVPWGKMNAELKIVFDGELPSSIRRLRLGHIRPYWKRLDREAQYGALPSCPTGEDVLGMCMDGSLIHLNLIDMNTTRFLRLIQALAEESDLICPFNQHENDDLQDEGPSEPTYRKHVDGDILQRCLDLGALERLIGEAGEVGMERFQELLGKVDGGKWTEGFTPEETAKWFEVAYDILSYFLAPVL